MRIIHIVHSYFPKIGGLERAVQGLAEAQARLGNEVTVLTSNIGLLSVIKREAIGNVEVIRLRSRKIFYNDLTIAIEKPILGRADIIHAHSQNSLFSVKLSEFLKKKLGTKVAFHFMAVDAFKDHPNLFIRLFGPYYGRETLKRALKVTDLPLTRSKRDIAILKQKYKVQAKYLPDAVPERYFTAERKDPSRFLEKYGIKHEKFFLFIGRLHKLKGPHILVKALKYVNDIAAVFIGPDGGFLKKTLNIATRIGVRDRVYILGYVNEEDKIWAIDSAVALVLPSIANHVEVYSLVISEAWARRKPVIGTNVGEVPYRIVHGLNGLIVNPSDPVALAKAMMKLVNDDELAAKMGEHGKNAVHSWSVIARKSIELYKHVLGQ